MKTVAFFPASTGRRAVSIIRHDTYPPTMRYEVVFQLSTRAISWQFAATRQEADAIASENR